MSGIVFFVAISMILSSGQNNTNPELTSVFQIIVPIVFVGALTVGRMLFRKRVQKINGSLPLLRKLEEYRMAALIMFAMFEAAGFLAVISTLVTGNLQFQLITGLVLVVFAILRPSTSRISQDLNLSSEEQSQLL